MTGYLARVAVPRLAHFVFGLREQHEPFHLVHYLAIESCRRTLAPEVIYFHHRHLPYGPYWDLVRPHLTLVEVDLVEDVDRASTDERLVPARYRYAHHADFIRLDALIETGGVYADIDTLFLRPFPADLFDHPFVIGREPPVRDEHTGALRPSTCNALLMAEPGAAFAKVWRAEMAGAMDGTWSNHTGFLAHDLAQRMPDDVHVVEPEVFFSFPSTVDGLHALLEEDVEPGDGLSIHLWAHLWWEDDRRDFTSVSAVTLTDDHLRTAATTYARLARPFLPPPGRVAGSPLGRCHWVGFDDRSGYAVAGERYRAALAAAGSPSSATRVLDTGVPGEFAVSADDVRNEAFDTVIATLVPEFFPAVRDWLAPDVLVGQTVWETDRLPAHWPPLLEVPDLLTVPCRWNAEAIRAAGIRTPVAVVPHVAPRVHRGDPAAWADIPPDVFVFATIGQWTERKAVDLTIRAYLDAFTRADPVLLVVKTSWVDSSSMAPVVQGHAGPGTAAAAVAKLMAARGADAPAVRLVTRDLGDDDIAALHARSDAYVSLCRAEGWGLGAFDSAAYGNPVVMTRYGGQLDYLDPATSWLVDYEPVPVDMPAGRPSYTEDQTWAEPVVAHGTALLREVFEAGPAARARAAPQAARILKDYAPAAVAAMLIGAIEGVRSSD